MLPITLVYGQRTREELYYHDEFLALAEQHPNFTYVPALSDEPADSDWTGFRGYVRKKPPRLTSTMTSATTRPTCVAPDHDRRVHHHPDAGAPVRERHLHREVLLGGRRAAGPQSALQAGLSLIKEYRESVKVSQIRRYSLERSPDVVRVVSITQRTDPGHQSRTGTIWRRASWQ